MQMENNTSATFLSRLRQAVQNDPRTKKAIADAAGVKGPALSRWLAGSTPDFPNMEKLARALNTSVSFLLFGDNAAVTSSTTPQALREDATPYHFTPAGLIPLGDALAQIRADLDAIERGPNAERRRGFLFMREAHIPMLARALHLD